MTIPYLHKRIVFISGVLCFLFSVKIDAQDTSAGLIRFFKIEKATNKNAVNLNWTIAAKNNDSVHVTIERSADGKKFQLLEMMPSCFAGMDSNYNYTDELPLSDSSIYRITCKTNGQASGYAVQKVNFFSRPKIEISVMPNPVFNNASIIIQTEETGDINCLLYDLNGKTIRTYQFKKTAYYAQHILDMYNVPQGEYILNVRGTVINESKRILKQ
ncbi:MAG: T9SS type A sorting domain-containing protein [Chitinophagaceae bacterium]|nr:T9SS type A sorting domain-containing protein [Chitinophagaceae bacterium]